MKNEIENEHIKMQEELIRLNSILECMLQRAADRDKKVDEMVKQVKEIATQNNEMYKPFKDATLVAKVLYRGMAYITGLLLACGSAYVLYKNVINLMYDK